MWGVKMRPIYAAAVMIVFMVTNCSALGEAYGTDLLTGNVKAFYPVVTDPRALANPAAVNATYIEDELLVRFKPGTSRDIHADVHARIGGRPIKDYESHGLPGLYLVKLAKGNSVPDAVSKYSRNPNVLYAEPNYIVQLAGIPNDPYFDSLWGLHNTGQSWGTPDSDIDAPEIWDLTHGSADVVIAVIDSGIDYTHPDLASNIWVNAGEIPNNGLDDDGNGYVDDLRGWDFLNNDNDPMDGNSHGTHCAGTIAAVGNNTIGITGVLWTAQIMPLKFIGPDGLGSVDDAIDAILYANRMGAHVISNSWGWDSTYLQSVKDAIDQSTAVVVCAAGNSGANTDIYPFYPSSYTSPHIISVAATDHNDNLADFPGWWGSNYGLSSVDVAAPGVDILSTYPENRYAWMSGTSMAAPHVAGVAGAVKSLCPEMSNLQMKDSLLNNVDQIPSLEGKIRYGGRVNAFESVSFTVVSEPVGILSSKESVIRSSAFLITIQGEPFRSYWLYIEDAGIAAAAYPTILPAQPGVNLSYPPAGWPAADNPPVIIDNAADVAQTVANVTTNSNGSRLIWFTTTTGTEDRAYTITLVDPTESSNNASVHVVVEKGEVTITASGTGTYYLGEDLTLSGTCTEGDTVYLMVTGPGLDPHGVRLDSLAPVGATNGFVTADVQAEDTWEYRWFTSDVPSRLEAGTYTVYAVSQPVNASDLGDIPHANISLLLRQPFVTASANSTTVVRGDAVVISGTATGEVSSVYVWILGTTNRLLSSPATVDTGANYDYTLGRADTASWAPGQYYAVVQHPGQNRNPDVFPLASTVMGNSWSGDQIDLADLTASEGAMALTNWINAPQSDDLSANVAFLIEVPWITIDPIGDKNIGDLFTVTGATNLAEGDHLQYAVRSTTLAVPREQTGTIPVIRDTAVNSWSFDVNTTNFGPDEYVVYIEWVDDSNATAETTFTLTPVVDTGIISVSSTPGGATIFLDGGTAGHITPSTLTDIPAGIHAVRLEKSGYVPNETSIEVVAGETVAVSLTLYLRGDLTHDNSVTWPDVVQCAYMGWGLVPVNPAADFDGQNGVDWNDVVRLAYYQWGLSTEL
jgi:subtilisin family serine protease